MKETNYFSGVWTALVTPFSSPDCGDSRDSGKFRDSNAELDLVTFRKLLHFQASAGVTGVIPCGSTGESVTLTEQEKKTLITTALEELKGSGVKVFAGVGSNNTAETLKLAQWASKQGVDGILVVTPYYNRPSQAGLETHFRTIADGVDCEVMPYNVPARTGVSLSVETIANLAKHPRINSLKEATGSVSFTSAILDALQFNEKKLNILSGDDVIYLPLLSVGAVGVVSVASNLFPRAMVEIQKAMEAGRVLDAQKIHQRYFPLFRDLFIECNPVPIKYAMSYAGLCNARVRLPLAPLTSDNAKKLELSLSRCGIERI